MPQPPCDHQNFESRVRVHRMIDNDGALNGRFNVDVVVRCRSCDMPLQFVGMRPGVSMLEPTVSIDGTEARLNAVEERAQMSPLDAVASKVMTRQ